jgi:DNA-binding NarL/FixJ family response regulator
MTARIFLVEDNDIVRESLAEYISAMGAYEVCGVAASAEEALDRLERLETATADAESLGLDLLVVDLSLPGMDGAQLIEHIGQRWPDTPCVICSGHRETTYVERALAAGSQGYILKGQPSELQEALPKILAGERYLSEKLPGSK